MLFERLDRLDDAYPIGWIVPRRIRSDQPVPRLFAAAPFPEDEVTLETFVAHLSRVTQTPILPVHSLLATQPSWKSQVVPWQRATARPYPVLSRQLARSVLTRRICLDDAGRGFVRFEPYDPENVTPVTVSADVPERVRQALLRMASASVVPSR